jgi:2-phosphoglycerate kinase
MQAGEPDAGLPYSKGLMAQALSASGLAPERAYELARAIEARLGEGDAAALAEAVLQEEEGDEAVRRYRDWQRIGALDRPLILMLAGTTGVGKSTLATMLASRIGITRVIATDAIRQVLRAFFTHDFMPAVHYSAFELDVAGFRQQAEAIGTGVEAILERACKEGTPMIVEGVHLVPGSIDPDLRGRCVAVEVVLAVDDEDLHRSHFHERGPGRPAERYLEGFEKIRRLQDYLVQRAKEEGVAVVDNTSVDHALTDVMRLVLDAAGRALAERGR